MNRDSQLKKCPFCGFSAHLSVLHFNFDDSYRAEIECGRCDARPFSYSSLDEEIAIEHVMNLWNARSDK